ncbi:MAG TPA: DMT family transporter [Burkholderiales bacterium]
MITDRRPLDAAAFGLMTLLCFLWGVQQVVVKLTAPYVSLVMQGGIRSALATVLLVAWARARGIALFGRDGTFRPGVLAGCLFSIEFVFIYAGLGHTSASRMVVFLYLTPPLTALGLAWLVPGERLTPVQWLGVLVSFGGIALAFSEGFLAAREATWIGDVCGVLAALCWAATTIVVRASALARASATKTLFYQLAAASVLLTLASWLMGEPGVLAVTPGVVASILYQGAIVAFASFLVWFWLLTQYFAARLAVLSFMTPLFGVLAGVLVLDEPLTPLFAIAAALVAAGIVLVNIGTRSAAPAAAPSPAGAPGRR